MAEDQIRIAFEIAWRPSTTSLVSQCDLVIHPDVAVMAAGCESLSKTAVDLYAFTAEFDADGDGSSMPGFVQSLQKSWAGLSATGFYDFYEDLTDLVYRYYSATLRLATTSACVTNAIAQYQQNILTNAEKTRDLAREVLQKWQKFENPFEITEVDADSRVLDVLDGVSLVAGVVSLAPGPQSLLTGGVSAVTGILSYVSKAVLESKAVALPTSVEIHDALSAALSSAQEQLLGVLDALRDDSTFPGGEGDVASLPVIPFSRFVQDSENNDGWKPPTVDFS
ncbi:hypothetical protein [Nocardioides humi]|uniref:hypothetical protein n=1 Tax=Nocardioides humi TaxID=449461 RepID=UPI0015E869A7|nr:hypothetical protein [Nocardioides humi]